MMLRNLDGYIMGFVVSVTNHRILLSWKEPLEVFILGGGPIELGCSKDCTLPEEWWLVVYRWSLLGPVLFKVFTSDLEEAMEHLSSLQVTPNWGDQPMQLRAVLPFGKISAGWRDEPTGALWYLAGTRGNSCHWMGTTLCSDPDETAWLEAAHQKGPLGLGCQWALAPKGGNNILGCLLRSRASGAGEATVPLYYTTSTLLYRVLGSQYEKDAVRSSVEDIKLVTGLEHLLCEEKLKKLGLFSLKKEVKTSGGPNSLSGYGYWR